MAFANCCHPSREDVDRACGIVFGSRRETNCPLLFGFFELSTKPPSPKGRTQREQLSSHCEPNTTSHTPPFDFPPCAQTQKRAERSLHPNVGNYLLACMQYGHTSPTIWNEGHAYWGTIARPDTSHEPKVSASPTSVAFYHVCLPSPTPIRLRRCRLRILACIFLFLFLCVFNVLFVFPTPLVFTLWFLYVFLMFA